MLSVYVLEEQSDLGPHCLHKWLKITDDKADDNSCDWQRFALWVKFSADNILQNFAYFSQEAKWSGSTLQRQGISQWAHDVKSMLHQRRWSYVVLTSCARCDLAYAGQV